MASSWLGTVDGWFVVVIAVALSACGDGTQETAEGTQTATTTPTTTEAEAETEMSGSTQTSAGPETQTETAVGTQTESDTDTGEATSESDTDDPEVTLAGGISVTEIFVNQGVGIRVAAEGVGLSPDTFAAPVIGGRPALVQASYALDPEFSPRALEAHLEITTGSDTETLVDTRTIDGPSEPDLLDGTFSWILDAEALADGSQIRVAIHEMDAESSNGSIQAPALPVQGTLDLGVWADPMVIDLVLVPFSCDGFGEVEITDADLGEFEAYLFNTFPVQAINISVHGVEYSESCSEVDVAEFDLPALRQAESAAPHVYYGGLMPGDGGGYSVAIQNSDQMDFRRTFANHTWRWYGLTFDLFAHELGHNHGRDHTFEDPDYPLQNQGNCGTRETYGYGVRPGLMPQCGYSNDKDIGINWISPNEELIPPTNTEPCDGLPEANRGSWSDMMSYAYPYWVSAYTYNHAAQRVRLISSWRSGAPQPTPQVPGLRVVFNSEGQRTARPVMMAATRTGVPHATATCTVGEGSETFPVYRHATHIDYPSGGALHQLEHTVVEIPGVPADASGCSWQLPEQEVIELAL